MQNKIIVVTIDEDGNNTFLKTEATDCFLELGTVVTRRASHVEPAGFWLRFAFSVLRGLFADTSKVAAWTRTWNTLWRVNTKPVGGPILTWADVHPKAGSGYFYINRDKTATWGPNTFGTRQDAIDAEIVFLNQFFAERKIS